MDQITDGAPVDTAETTSTAEPSPIDYDPQALMTEAYEKWANDYARRDLPLEKLLTRIPTVEKVHGYLTADEYKRFARGLMCRVNASVLVKQAQREDRRQNNILNGLLTEVTERLDVEDVKPPPMIDGATGAVVSVAQGITPPATPEPPPGAEAEDETDQGAAPAEPGAGG